MATKKKTITSPTAPVFPSSPSDPPFVPSECWLHYTVAVDKPGESVRFEQAWWWLKSLFEVADWRGEAILITNQQRDLRELEGKVRLVVHPFLDFVNGDAQPRAQQLRHRAADVLTQEVGRIEDFDGVFYADSDCIAREPLEDMIMRIGEADLLVTWEKGSNMQRHFASGGLLQGDEIHEARRHRAINSGTFCVRGAAFRAVMTSWNELANGPSREGNWYLCDQPALNRLVLQCYLGRAPFRVEHLPLDAVCFPLPNHVKMLGEQTIWMASLWHYAGNGDPRTRLRRMRAEYFTRRRIVDRHGRTRLKDLDRRYNAAVDINNTTSGLKEFVREMVPEQGLYVETGTNWGVSAAAVAKERPELEIVTIDIAATPEAQDRLGAFSNVRILTADSRAAAAQFEDCSVDVLYLDADHHKEFVVSELEAWLPKMKPGGVIAGHDYFNLLDVQQAVREVLGEYADRAYPDTTWCYRLPS